MEHSMEYLKNNIKKIIFHKILYSMKTFLQTLISSFILLLKYQIYQFFKCYFIYIHFRKEKLKLFEFIYE